MEIYCLGDSLTEGRADGNGENWVSLLNRETCHHWHNCGVAGDTSLGMLVRLQTQILPNKPWMVIYLGGFNDILLTGSADQAKSAVMAFVNQCAHEGVRPVVGIPYDVSSVPAPWNRLCDSKKALAALDEYIRWLRCFTKGVMLRSVDFCEVGQYLMEDGIHPSARGHRVMADAVIASGIVKGAPK